MDPRGALCKHQAAELGRKKSRGQLAFYSKASEAAAESKGSSAAARLDITSHLKVSHVSVHSVSPPRPTAPNELGFDATLDRELHKPSQDENVMGIHMARRVMALWMPLMKV